MARKENLQRESTAFGFFKSSDIVLATVLILFGVLFQLFETEIIAPESLTRWWPTITQGLEAVLETLRDVLD